MKSIKSAFSIVAIGMFLSTAIAQSKERELKDQPSTVIKFRDQEVRGKYQNSAEAIAKIEREKEISNLMHMRTHFKDRLARSTQGR